MRLFEVFGFADARKGRRPRDWHVGKPRRGRKGSGKTAGSKSGPWATAYSFRPVSDSPEMGHADEAI